jgi:hypothetical protein
LFFCATRIPSGNTGFRYAAQLAAELRSENSGLAFYKEVAAFDLF